LHQVDGGLFRQSSKHMYVTLLTLLSQMNPIFYNIPHVNTICILILVYIVIEQMLSSTVGFGSQPSVQYATVE
jgi:hypothetical protein